MVNVGGEQLSGEIEIVAHYDDQTGELKESPFKVKLDNGDEYWVKGCDLEKNKNKIRESKVGKDLRITSIEGIKIAIFNEKVDEADIEKLEYVIERLKLCDKDLLRGFNTSDLPEAIRVLTGKDLWEYFKQKRIPIVFESTIMVDSAHEERWVDTPPSDKIRAHTNEGSVSIGPRSLESRTTEGDFVHEIAHVAESTFHLNDDQIGRIDNGLEYCSDFAKTVTRNWEEFERGNL